MQRYVFYQTKKCSLVLAALVATFFLGACGPKTVGDAMDSTESTAVSAAYDPGQARYPMAGQGARSLDKALYILNTPAFMQARQQNLDTFLRQSYAKDAPNDYTNLQPRQVSPFRE